MVSSLIVLVMPFMTHYLSPAGSFWSNFGILLIFGAFNGILQGTVYGLAGILPFKYIGAVMFGNGVSGVMMNSLRAILQLILPGDNNLHTVSLLFFIVAAILLWICAAMYSILYTSPFFLYYKDLSEGKTPSTECQKGKVDDKQVELLQQEEKPEMTFGEVWQQMKDNFKMAYPMLLGMWFVFFVTFIIFPGTFFSSQFKFMDGMKKDRVAWYNIAIILGFNITDTVGRKVAGTFSVSNNMVPILSLIRMIFIPTTYFIAHYNSSPEKGMALW